MFQEDDALPGLFQEICHDIQNPAVAARLVAQSLAGDPSMSKRLVERLESIVSELRSIEDICSYFLQDHAALDASVRLDLLAGDLVRSARQLRRASDIEVFTSPTLVDLHPVTARRLIRNLLENACRAAGGSGRVRVGVFTSEDGEAAELTVEDSGPGFDLGPLAPVLASVIAVGTASLGLRIVERIVGGAGGTTTISQSTLGGAGIVVRLPTSRAVGHPRLVGGQERSGQDRCD